MDHSVLRLELGDGYRIPRIINGAWQLSAGHSSAPVDPYAVLSAWSQMCEQGLNTFDCADIYTGVEELLGEFLAVHTGNIQIHTKFVPDRSALPQVDKAYVERIIDRSLRRLGIDCLDLVQFYWWDSDVPGCVQTARWLDELRVAGKIRNIGVTNFDVPRLQELLDAGVAVVSNQVQYSLVDARPENGMAALCGRHAIKLLCYGTVAGGFLSERWLGRPEPPDMLANRSLTKYKLVIDEFGGWDLFQELLTCLSEVARKHRALLATVAIRWVLERPEVAAAIVGARSAEHLAATMAVFSLALDADDLVALDAVLARRSGPAGDIFERERDPDGPHAGIMRYDLNADG